MAKDKPQSTLNQRITKPQIFLNSTAKKSRSRESYRRKNITDDQVQAFSKAVSAGEPLSSALVEHLGYSPESAKRGKACIPKELQLRLAKDGLRMFATIGKSFDAQQQEHFVRGKALMGAIEGTDKGFNMLKLLAQDKRVNMLTPDSVAGLVVIEVPRSLPALSESQHSESLTPSREK